MTAIILIFCLTALWQLFCGWRQYQRAYAQTIRPGVCQKAPGMPVASLPQSTGIPTSL